ncbi:MAG: hypothetical protein EHM48_10140, partial [Planctomycetaceae bacterium]
MKTNSFVRIIIAIAAASTVNVLATFAAPPALTDDAPPLPPPKNGNISGTIGPAEKLATLTAVSRPSGKTFAPAEFDRKTGKFTFKNLP